MSKRNWLAGTVTIASLLVLGLAALVPAPERSLARLPQDPAGLPADVDVAYQALTFDQMARQSGAILAGQVTRISPTLWNQDGGEYWEETITDAAGLQTLDHALPYYEIELAVSEPIVDAIGLDARIRAGQPIVLTVIGMSPRQDPDTAAASADAMVVADGDTRLHVGDAIVAFARPTRMAWRDGSRAILAPMGAPAQSAVRVGPADVSSDGIPSDDTMALDALKDQILAARGGSATE